jgi:hypothetical protein
MFNNVFFSENIAVYEILLKKYSRAGQAKDDNKKHAHYTLDTYDHKHTQNVTVYCFSIATLVA